MSALTIPFSRVVEALEGSEWTFAKTMPKNPHFWTAVEGWGRTIEEWDAVVEYIREHGEDLRHWSKVYRVLYLNGWRYWTMGSPVADTTIINRAEMKSYDEHPYDRIAPSYDALFTSEGAHEEEYLVWKALGTPGERVGKILDIGCGSGWLLDHIAQDDEYLGIDPSVVMRRLFCQRRAAMPETPVYVIGHQTIKFEHFWEGGFNNIVALFGVASYLKPNAIDQAMDMLKPGGKAFFMYYDPDYEPLTHSATNIFPKRYPTPEGLPPIFGKYRLDERTKP